ncbi:hypothetical protein [Candidatus Uabimicrobium sp. HlEnr_7]|uniref:hypothetical protein n=1 Tax=Candidatus Uabimicrobium helgolandensis TaxID=3095367 RepID=UPI003556E91A
MKYTLYFIIFFLPFFAFADKNGTPYYFFGEKLLSEKEYQELNSKDRKKVEFSFNTVWTARAGRDKNNAVLTSLISKEIQVFVFSDTGSRLLQGATFFTEVAKHYQEVFKIKDKFKKGRTQFGKKKCYSSSNRTKDGKFIQIITRSSRNKCWRIIIVINEKDLRLKPVRTAFSLFMKSFRFLM